MSEFCNLHTVVYIEIMQRIAVFGGTGMTGQCVVDYALEKGKPIEIIKKCNILHI